MNRLIVVMMVVAGFLWAGGCSLLDGSARLAGMWGVEPGAIIFYGHTSDVQLATDTVRVGESLHVSATTFGGGCTRAAGMSASMSGLTTIVTPLDSVYTPGPDEACTEELKFLPHETDITFASTGEARVVIHGIRRGPHFDDGEAVQLERIVIVVE